MSAPIAAGYGRGRAVTVRIHQGFVSIRDLSSEDNDAPQVGWFATSLR